MSKKLAEISGNKLFEYFNLLDCIVDYWETTGDIPSPFVLKQASLPQLRSCEEQLDFEADNCPKISNFMDLTCYWNIDQCLCVDFFTFKSCQKANECLQTH